MQQKGLATKTQWQTRSQELMQCISKAATDQTAQIALIDRTSELMPAGVPNFKELANYPWMQSLVEEHGRKTMVGLMVVLIGDFCSSFNVVRNMTGAQMYEAAVMLVDACGNYRLEDYQMMFTLGKRNQLGKVLDHIDINVISAMRDAYQKYRQAEGERIQREEYEEYERRLKQFPSLPTSQEDKEMSDRFSEIAKQMTGWMQQEEDSQREERKREEQERKDQQKQKIQEYAQQHGVNMEEVVKQFSQPKNDR